MKKNMFADFTIRIPFEERLSLIRNNGFDGVMLGFSDGLKYTQYETAEKFGLEIENVHSPFDRMNALWEKRVESEYILQRTMDCIKISAENNVNTVVIHLTDGLISPQVSRFGLYNFDKLVNFAEQKNVTLAFENIQLPQFLDVIFSKFSNSDRVKFCYDVGHENCFTKGSDCLEKYGDKLVCLHIHDNDGTSDGHMIPFDACIEYSLFFQKLKNLEWKGPMSYELYMNKINYYEGCTPQRFVERAYNSAVRFESLYKTLNL